jgi:hypothetical protein
LAHIYSFAEEEKGITKSMLKREAKKRKRK